MTSPRVADGLECFRLTENLFRGVLNHFIASTPMSISKLRTLAKPMLTYCPVQKMRSNCPAITCPNQLVYSCDVRFGELTIAGPVKLKGAKSTKPPDEASLMPNGCLFR